MTTLTLEEEAQLRPEYEKYLRDNYELYKRTGKAAGLHFEKVSLPMSFNQWWRVMADEIKSERPGK